MRWWGLKLRQRVLKAKIIWVSTILILQFDPESSFLITYPNKKSKNICKMKIDM